MAEGTLPPPEAMVQIWQVPIARPYAVGDAQMIMFGVGQTFPAPGSQSARRRAAEHEAEAEQALGTDAARRVRLQMDHAFADYVEATSRHRVHIDHRAVAARTVEIARARHAGGGSLADLAQADVELARMDADVITDGTRVDAARGRINALLGRDVLAPLGGPAMNAPAIAEWDVRAAIDKAHASRPELRASVALRDARREEARASEREAVIPSFSVAALYFSPTSVLPQHGYGANATMTLPWLWNEARSRRDARNDLAAAMESERAATLRSIDAEVAAQEAMVRASGLRLQTLRDRALPAAHRAFEVVWAGFETSRIPTLTVLAARRAVVDIESELVAARATLDHALADLDAAVGVEVPRRALGARASTSDHEGATHGD
ncbi:MAG: TolC family protein [Labilithrix sp.]